MTTTDPEDGMAAEAFIALAEMPPLTLDDQKRLVVEIVEHHGPMTREEVIAAGEVAADDYYQMVLSVGLWTAWRERLIKFGVKDGEIVVLPGYLTEADVRAAAAEAAG